MLLLSIVRFFIGKTICGDPRAGRHGRRVGPPVERSARGGGGGGHDRPAVHRPHDGHAAPGLLATLALAPWVIRIFFTEAFLPVAELLQWFILGCLGRVISWPLGFVMLALGKGRWYFVTETAANGAHLALIGVGLVVLGLEGVAIAFFVLYLAYTAGVYGVARHLTGFRWSASSRRLLLLVLPIVAVTFVAARLLPLWPATGFGVAATTVATVLCLRGLVQRIGADHRIVRAAGRVPGMRWVLRLKAKG